MDIKIVGENNQEVIKENLPMESRQAVDSPALPDMEIRAIGQTVGLENDSEYNKYGDNLNTLLGYAKTQTDDHSIDNLKWVIRNLEFKLGSPPLGEKLITYAARYAWLSMEGKKIEQEKKEFERG